MCVRGGGGRGLSRGNCPGGNRSAGVGGGGRWGCLWGEVENYPDTLLVYFT